MRRHSLLSVIFEFAPLIHLHCYLSGLCNDSRSGRTRQGLTSDQGGSLILRRKNQELLGKKAMMNSRSRVAEKLPFMQEYGNKLAMWLPLLRCNSPKKDI